MKIPPMDMQDAILIAQGAMLDAWTRNEARKRRTVELDRSLRDLKRAYRMLSEAYDRIEHDV